MHTLPSHPGPVVWTLRLCGQKLRDHGGESATLPSVPSVKNRQGVGLFSGLGALSVQSRGSSHSYPILPAPTPQALTLWSCTEFRQAMTKRQGSPRSGYWCCAQPKAEEEKGQEGRVDRVWAAQDLTISYPEETQSQPHLHPVFSGSL